MIKSTSNVSNEDDGDNQDDDENEDDDDDKNSDEDMDASDGEKEMEGSDEEDDEEEENDEDEESGGNAGDWANGTCTQVLVDRLCDHQPGHSGEPGFSLTSVAVLFSKIVE